MSLRERLSKVGLKTTKLSESEVYQDRDMTTTSVYSLNIALSGDLDTGFGSGVGILAGPSKHYKSNTGLIMIADYLRKNPDAFCLFYDSEFGAPPSYWESQGIDASRIDHVPITNIEDIKFDMPQKLQEINRGDKVIIFVDSIGNLASKKEQTDAIDGKATVDMTRAREIKSMFRIVTPMIKLRNLPAIWVAHTYNTMEMFSKAVVSGGTGLYYSADWIIIFGRQQEKEGNEIAGYNFILNIEKSRFVREKSKVPLQVMFDTGISKYSGIIDLALESGDVVKKISKGTYYALVNKETGEIGEYVKASKVGTDEFLGIVVARKEFKEFINKKYKLSGHQISEEEIDEGADDFMGEEDDYQA